ncbi:pyruvate dehydrogenase E2 component (dihydrolipoamide acetyltransferase) [Albimonas donghaensis]|uniref:Acetyltransferase component of pyruvate dehydrogenase complex n=1 Tax=Albimonas donghaensis TaxID=356660 RepID=A0A1H2SWI5_9RHOB|nr:pyruvate dehydrogenase complex dihydrolipoamide acetyltransferase [Albimonas donghaensis]SDW35958.1 pyruvate dehydrogenase E2 component (dihydrolipoamide acetyltransferase) [Albimonas donghaensis]
MAIQILMPALSPTMEEGTLAKWCVKEGDSVSSGDVIAEIETDKATMEFEAVDEGVIGKILIEEGTEGVKVNTPIAVLLEEGEDASAADSAGAPAAPAPKEEPAPEPEAKSEAPAPAPASPAPASPAPAAPKDADGDRIFASPLARRIAADKGLDLAAIKGSGPRGRIVKADVEAAKPAAAAPAEAPAAAPAAKAAAPAPADAEAVKKLYADVAFEEVKLDGMRRTIALRLVEAKQTIPHFYLRREIELDALMAFRAELNGALASRGVKLSVNDFIIKACALALQQVPDCNAVWAGDRVLKFKASDVAVAVAIEGGLFTPVLRSADSKSLSALSAEMKDLAGRARDRKLAPHEYQGGSFAISNLGMMGIENFDAVINPPHASILAVGAGLKKPVVGADGELKVATVMSVTLSVDHRVIDGALGAEFLAAVKDALENPVAMLA